MPLARGPCRAVPQHATRGDGSGWGASRAAITSGSADVAPAIVSAALRHLMAFSRRVDMGASASGRLRPSARIEMLLEPLPRRLGVRCCDVPSVEFGDVERDLAEFPPQALQPKCIVVERPSRLARVVGGGLGVFVDQRPEVSLARRKPRRVPVDERSAIRREDHVSSVWLSVRHHRVVIAPPNRRGKLVVRVQGGGQAAGMTAEQ
mgnify:FL=1